MKKDPGLARPDLLGAVRACYGGLLLCAPRRMVSVVIRGPVSGRTVNVIRVLGARHLVQATLTAAILPAAELAGIPPRTVLQAGAAVDTTHAASMIALALAGRPLRRAAWADALLEAGLAAFGIITARGAGVRAPGGQARARGPRMCGRPAISSRGGRPSRLSPG